VTAFNLRWKASFSLKPTPVIDYSAIVCNWSVGSVGREPNGAG